MRSFIGSIPIFNSPSQVKFFLNSFFLYSRSINTTPLLETSCRKKTSLPIRKAYLILFFLFYFQLTPAINCFATNQSIESTIELLKKHIANRPEISLNMDVNCFLQPIKQALSHQKQNKSLTCRLNIISKGFKRYWSERIASQWDPNSALMAQARLRWYVEDAMKRELLEPSEIITVKEQHQRLLEHTITSLQGEFPFIEPNTFIALQTDLLNKIHTWIDIPFEPVYTRKLTEQQCLKIKTHWDSQYRWRANIWRQLPSSILYDSSSKEAQVTPNQRRKQYHVRFITLCLDKHIQILWNVIIQQPEYLSKAINTTKGLHETNRISSKEMEARLDSFNPQIRNPLEQIEVWGFILSVLLQESSSNYKADY